MPTTRFLTQSLLLLGLLLAVQGCAQQIPAQQFPPVADLQVQAKPVPTVEILTSEKAANDYDASVEAWGMAGWLQVGRICRWARDMGLKDAPCRD